MAIAAAGDIYRHEYEAVDERLIWDTVGSGLEQLREAVTREIQGLRAGRAEERG